MSPAVSGMPPRGTVKKAALRSTDAFTLRRSQILLASARGETPPAAVIIEQRVARGAAERLGALSGQSADEADEDDKLQTFHGFAPRAGEEAMIAHSAVSAAPCADGSKLECPSMGAGAAY